jgi:hypothetical protein
MDDSFGRSRSDIAGVLCYTYRVIGTLAGRQHYAYESVTIYYRWHALRRKTLLVLRRERQCRGDVLVCELPDGELVCIPVWMTDPACADFKIGSPQMSVESLLALRELLTAARKAEPSGAIADNRPIQEEGHETVRTDDTVAMESAADRHNRAGTARADGTGVRSDGSADPGGAPSSFGSQRSTRGEP